MNRPALYAWVLADARKECGEAFERRWRRCLRYRRHAPPTAKKFCSISMSGAQPADYATTRAQLETTSQQVHVPLCKRVVSELTKVRQLNLPRRPRDGFRRSPASALRKRSMASARSME